LKPGLKIFILLFFVAMTSLAQHTTPAQGIIPPAQNEEIFTIVEQNAEFPGGVAELQKYLKSTIAIPAEAREAGISGKCFLKFIVTSEGKIRNVEVLKGVPGCIECNKEAIRAIREMPDWTPAKQNGKPVNVYYNLPINFG
jgi:periplasmic protein TonB